MFVHFDEVNICYFAQHAVDFRKLHELSICSLTVSFLTMGLESLDSNRIHLTLLMVS
jgi:hypothetical protein